MIKALIERFKKDESGATAIEYGLIAGLISVAIIVTVTLAGDRLTGTFQAVADALSPAAEAPVEPTP